MIGRLAIGALAAFLAVAAGAAPQGPVPTGDPARGEQIYARCLACHSLEVNRTGPRHCGLLNRRAGSVPGFDYSEAMASSGIVWTPEALDRFLANPLAAVPGTRMTFAGIPDAAERRDLIAWLAIATTDPARCGSR